MVIARCNKWHPRRSFLGTDNTLREVSYAFETTRPIPDLNQNLESCMVAGGRRHDLKNRCVLIDINQNNFASNARRLGLIRHAEFDVNPLVS